MASGIPYVIPIGKDKPKIITLVPNDPGSRYKTRQLQIQVVGKSKMIKTFLVNILDVSKDMQVPPSWIGTFMGYEIGAQAKFDAKKPERQQAHITGEHEVKDLSAILEKFLTEVVLCPVCGLPEILIGFEGKKIMGKCRACGGNSEMPINNEKFINFIFKNPPSSGGKSESAAFKGNTASSKKESTKSSKEAKPKTSKKKKADDDDSEEDDDGVVWFTDTSEEAARKRREEMMPESLELKRKESEIEEFSKILKEEAPEKTFDKLNKLKSTFGLNDEEFFEDICEALFGSTNDLQAQIKAYPHILKNYFKDEKSKQHLLKYFDKLCGTTNTALAPKIALVLKDLYDMDILEEPMILSWYQDENTAQLLKDKATPLIKWFKEAEEESDDDEDDDDDDDDEDD